MIGVLSTFASSEAGQLVLAAIRRSVAQTQAQPCVLADLKAETVNTIVAVDIEDNWGADLLGWVNARPSKLLLFGNMPSAMAQYLECKTAGWPEGLQEASRSFPAPVGEWRESRGVVNYTPLADRLGGRRWHRALERFDFTDEWNNFGFGAIRTDGSIWALSQSIHVPAERALAVVHVNGEPKFSYAALFDLGNASILWFNRPVGPCDSYEWRLVENFLSSYRADELPCHPVLSEIPWGHDAAITMRLDCDEDVESARPLWQTYQHHEIPFSLAVHTLNLGNDINHPILRELLASGGAVLSHTATHAPNWGGSYEAALQEAKESAFRLQSVTDAPVRYAVSPFHQTPPYSLCALSDAGYQGCIGGIIRNDPEFLLARGGSLANLPVGFVGHSQQCMLHGDCMLKQGDPLAIFKQAFDLAFDTKTLFGYLDHPFSERYQYGWTDEAVRIEAHKEFIAYIRKKAAQPLFMNEETALDFLALKSMSQVLDGEGGFRIHVSESDYGLPQLAVEFRGQYHQVINGMRLQ